MCIYTPHHLDSIYIYSTSPSDTLELLLVDRLHLPVNATNESSVVVARSPTCTSGTVSKSLRVGAGEVGLGGNEKGQQRARRVG